MSNTDSNEQQSCEAPHGELCDKALAHYEEVSTAAHHWNSLVPRAIEFYKLHGDRASVAAPEGDDNDDLSMSVDEAVAFIVQQEPAAVSFPASPVQPKDRCEHGILWSMECLSCPEPEYVAVRSATCPVKAARSVEHDYRYDKVRDGMFCFACDQPRPTEAAPQPEGEQGDELRFFDDGHADLGMNFIEFEPTATPPNTPAGEQWTCFHCGEILGRDAAEKHFGVSEDEIAECLKLRAEMSDQIATELANWHSHKQQLITVLVSFVGSNPKHYSFGVEQDPCGGHALLEWIQNETWYGFEFPGSAANAIATIRAATPPDTASDAARAAAEEISAWIEDSTKQRPSDDEIAAIITKYFAATTSPLSETAVGGRARKCVKCGHDDGVDENGVCCNKDYDPKMTSCLCHGCLCKCEFTAPVPDAVDDEGEIETRVGRLPLSLLDEIQERRNTIYTGFDYFKSAPQMKTDLDHVLAIAAALRSGKES